MSLQIEIVDPRPFYHPGDQVGGNVILDSKKSEDIAQVIVEFTGRCKVKVRRHDHYTTISHRTRGYYFRLQDLLYDGGNFTFQVGVRSWPFSFTIPLQAESEDPRSQRPLAKRQLDNIGILKRNDLEGLESDHFSSSPTWRGSYDAFRGRPDPHRLPDTFDYVSNRFPASCEARVEYELTATLKRPTRGVLFPAKDLEASSIIELRSRNHLKDFRLRTAKRSPEDSQIVNISPSVASSQLGSKNGSSLSSLIDRATMSFKKPTDVQEMTFSISAVLDRKLRPGGLGVLLLQASQERGADPTKQSPTQELRLRSYTLTLVARTALRAKLEAVMVQDVNHYAVDRRVLLSDKGLDLNIPWNPDGIPTTRPVPTTASGSFVGGWLNLSAARPTYDSDRQVMTPTFKTYNISREYSLSLECKVDCAGVKYDVKSENIDLTVLAEQDHVESSPGERPAPAYGRATTSSGLPPPHSPTDSKAALREQQSRDEKQGPIPPPPPREPETEQLPRYEPGDVPGYHADDEASRPPAD